MEEEPVNSSTTVIGEAVTTSCERCRRRKIKCDRRQPCSRCRKAGTNCVRGGTGEKQRPIPKTYVQALENQVASLETFIQKLTRASHEQRDDMLAGYCPTTAIIPATSPQDAGEPPPAVDDDKSEEASTYSRARAGQIRRLTTGTSAHFYGSASLFQTLPMSPQSETTTTTAKVAPLGVSPENEGYSPAAGSFPYPPHHDVCQQLMANFFKERYQFNMCIYREYFLRDYDTGAGRYYSDMLLYAICSLGAFSTTDNHDHTPRELSEVFSAQAQALLPMAFDNPDLTALQALLLLAQRETGYGRASKGWLFSGMAFRLAHEMGLHLDPAHWDNTDTEKHGQALVDREILRRVYWAAFNADKQFSLFFGRPPALYLHESDVRDTIRLPYPPDWEGLLETYIAPGLSVTAYEDGFALVGAFIYQTELSKIIHAMITDLFENRRVNPNSAAVTATVQKTHLSLTKWLASLPQKLYWNQWTVGKVPACVLHLHMLFHTVMIILHRPPPKLLAKPDIAASEDVEICYQSLQAILRLMKSYSRFYRYESLPLDFVQTLSTAAGIILMQRRLEEGIASSAARDLEESRSLRLVLDAMDVVQEAWPCVAEVKAIILQACEYQTAQTMGTAPSVPETDNMAALMDFGMPLAGDDGAYDNWLGGGDDGPSASDNMAYDVDLGPLITDELLGGSFLWNAQG